MLQSKTNSDALATTATAVPTETTLIIKRKVGN
jgi:hypothetical protein